MRCDDGGVILGHQVESFLNLRFAEQINTGSLFGSVAKKF